VVVTNAGEREEVATADRLTSSTIGSPISRAWVASNYRSTFCLLEAAEDQAQVAATDENQVDPGRAGRPIGDRETCAAGWGRTTSAAQVTARTRSHGYLA